MSRIVLCVDDSQTMQQVADITFRGTEFQYVGARTVEEAISKAKSQKPTIVLADAVMPGKNGYDLCLTLKQDPGTADVPVVILIGNNAPYDVARGTQVGADANLPKPWDTSAMLEKVIELVGKGATAKPGQASAAAAAPVAAPPASKPAATAPVPAKHPVPQQEPPRSATIMGMPTIKMPAGVAPVATPIPSSTKTTAMAVPPIAPEAMATAPGSAGGPGLRPPAKSAPVAATPAASIAPSSNGGIAGMNRASMVSGSPTKRSALVDRTLAKMAARLAEAAGIEPGSPELLALLKLSTEVVERIVWEVVPELAEQIIRENLAALTKRS
ncbi:MAG: response regulator [Kofleriaceae bacterium]